MQTTAPAKVRMPVTTVTSRDLARDLAKAKKAANAGPVIVADRGRPTYALLEIEDHYRLSGAKLERLSTG